LDKLCRQAEIEYGKWHSYGTFVDPEIHRTDTINLFKSGKVEVLMDEYMDLSNDDDKNDNENGNDEYMASLIKLRFFGKTQDQFINVMASEVHVDTLDDSLACIARIEVDPTSPAIGEFKSLQEALNKVSTSKHDGYPSLLVLISEQLFHEGNCNSPLRIL
jgi:hypothetical protein